MRKSDPIGLAKAILWEEAKGKLRALVAADGAAHNDDRGPPVYPDQPFHFQKVSAEVEGFIKSFESEGFHE